MKKLKTNKKPFLFTKVQEAWERWGKPSTGSGSEIQDIASLRDAVSIVLGFFFGCRAGELVAFQIKDVSLVGEIVRLTFHKRKTLRSALSTHQSQTISASHPLLCEALRTWLGRLKELGAPTSTPLFPSFGKIRSVKTIIWSRIVPLSAATIRFRCKDIDPDCVAHSLRAGLATEAWAAGVPTEAIMALGGWTSPVAIMYIVGASDETVAASMRLGSAAMRYEGNDLRAKLGTSRLSRSTWFA